MHLPNEILLHIFFFFEEDPMYVTNLPQKETQSWPGIATLSNLCLVSKDFQSVVQPLLYHSLPAQNERRRQLLFRTLSQRLDLARLARHVVLAASEEPSQAVSNAWIAIRQSVDFPCQLKNRISRALRMVVNDDIVYYDDDYPLIRKQSTDTIYEDEDSKLFDPPWYVQVARDAELAVFLALVPNVESLSVEVPLRYDLLLDTFCAAKVAVKLAAKYPKRDGITTVEGTITTTHHTDSSSTTAMTTTVTLASTPLTPLSRVRRLQIANWDDENALWMLHFRHGLLLPSLTELSCSMVNFSDFTYVPRIPWPPAPMPMRPRTRPPPPSLMHMPLSCLPPPKLECIDLDTSLIDAAGLRALLDAFGSDGHERRPLHTLCIRWGSEWLGECSLDFTKIGEELRRYPGRSDLRVLNLDLRFALDFNDNIRETTGKLGSSLRELDGLERLGVAQRMLVGFDGIRGFENSQRWPRLADILPTTLKYLHVTEFLGEIEDEDYPYDQLAALTKDKRFPGLREMQVVYVRGQDSFINASPPALFTEMGEGSIVLERNSILASEEAMTAMAYAIRQDMLAL